MKYLEEFFKRKDCTQKQYEPFEIGTQLQLNEYEELLLTTHMGCCFIERHTYENYIEK